MKNILLFTLGITGLLYQFYAFPGAQYLLPALAVLTIIWFLPSLSIIPRISSIVMLAAGNIIFFVEDSLHYSIWSYGFLKSLPIVTLFLFVPLLQIPIELGGYTKYTERFARSKLSSPGRFYWVTAGIFFLLAPVLNLSIYRIYYDIMKTVPLSKKTITLSMQRSFTSVATWAPYFVGVGLIASYVPFKILNFLAAAIFIAFIQLLVCYLLYLWDVRSEEFIIPASPANKDKEATKKMMGLSLWMLLLLVTIIPLEILLGKKMIVIVAVAAIFQSVIWSLFLGKAKQFVVELKPYFQQRGARVINEAVFFLSAGFFAEILNRSFVGAWIADHIVYLTQTSSLFFTILLIMLVIPMLAAAGIHHMIPIVAIASTIPAEALGMPVTLYGLMFTITWGTSALISPFSPMNAAVGTTVGLDQFKVGPIWNAKAVLILIVVMSLVLYGLTKLPLPL